MKHTLIGIIASVGIVASAVAQTTNAPAPTPTQVISQIGRDIESATNIAVAPYATYGLKNHKIGGGLLALYNFNNYVGAGAGVDYLGREFSMVSANVELKLPVRPLAFIGWTNFLTTPFVFSGLGTPMGGAHGASAVSTHVGAGMNVDIVKALGGTISLGGAYIKRQGAGGDFDGAYANMYLAWRHGF